MASPSDWDRFHADGSSGDHRSPAQRDRDRILYTLAFRRLAGVTQVVGAVEGHIFHNRLTHTVEVAQIARRLAEYFVQEHPDAVTAIGGIDPDVAEAAAFAHDLGHPPFGHIAEEELDRLAVANGDPDGFEGNAQSFRIVTRLTAHRAAAEDVGYVGLNLTRRTMNAVLKYPWLRDIGGKDQRSKHYRKYSAYRTEEREFSFARQMSKWSEAQSIEAAVMDHADDVAYSVHDFDDFYRAGLIPAVELLNVPSEQDSFFEWWVRADKHDPAVARTRRAGLFEMLDTINTGERYRGTFSQRAAMRTATSILISRFLYAAYLRVPDSTNSKFIYVDPQREMEISFLKGLVRRYVISNPRLATQQHGQREIIRTLFATYAGAVKRRDENLVPPLFQNELRKLGARRQSNADDPQETRLAVDIVASFTDNQAVLMHQRLSGARSGSVLDLLDV